jgi:hypothetical protein
LIFDDQINIKTTIVKGEIIYTAPENQQKQNVFK